MVPSCRLRSLCSRCVPRRSASRHGMRAACTGQRSIGPLPRPTRSPSALGAGAAAAAAVSRRPRVHPGTGTAAAEASHQATHVHPFIAPLQYVEDDDVAAKYTCARCGADTASESGLLVRGGSSLALHHACSAACTAQQGVRRQCAHTGSAAACRETAPQPATNHPSIQTPAASTALANGPYPPPSCRSGRATWEPVRRRCCSAAPSMWSRAARSGRRCGCQLWLCCGHAGGFVGAAGIGQLYFWPLHQPALESSACACLPLPPQRALYAPHSSCRPAPPQILSTGRYTLLDLQCRCCRAPLGWRYLTADSPDQRYKEGACLLQQGSLKRVGSGERVSGGGGSGGSGSGLSSPGLSSPGLSSPSSGSPPLRASPPLSPSQALAQLARLHE